MANHAQKILDRFPSFLRTDLPGKTIDVIAGALGGQLDEAERQTNRIQRAHRIGVADEAGDVLRLAALLGLQPEDFFILNNFRQNRFFELAEKDVSISFTGGQTELDFVLKIATTGTLKDIQAELQQKMQALLAPPATSVALRDIIDQASRSKLYRLRSVVPTGARSGAVAETLATVTVQIGNPQDPQDLEQRAYSAYLDQLRTAVERMAAILFDGCGTIHALLEGASVLLDAQTTGPMQHPDVGQLRGGFIHQLPISYITLQSGQPVLQQGLLYMVENPLTDHNTDDLDRKQLDVFRVTRKGFFPQLVSVQITGKGNRTVWPSVINKTTHEGVGFRKAITDGQKLLFTSDGKVSLDGTDATVSGYYFHGGLFDDAHADSQKPDDARPVVTPPGSLDRNYPRPAITPATTLPAMTIPIGDSDWRFSVAEGAFDASGFDEAVFDGADPAASAKVQLLWKEEKPFSVLILIPAEMKPLEQSVLGRADLRKLLRGGLERFRTAGIELQVDYFDPKWISKKSIVKSQDATKRLGSVSKSSARPSRDRKNV